MKTFVIGDIHGRRAQLNRLLEIIPRDAERDMLILLGDIIDRGADVPGTVADVVKLHDEQPERVLWPARQPRTDALDFVDESATLWLHAAVGANALSSSTRGSPCACRVKRISPRCARLSSPPSRPRTLNSFANLPLYHEDDYAIYVHAGLSKGQHPRDTPPQHLLWSRDGDFFRNYTGKPCIFGHTPAPLLPLRGSPRSPRHLHLPQRHRH
jgi:serine/threonine protein phosphatase 1